MGRLRKRDHLPLGLAIARRVLDALPVVVVEGVGRAKASSYSASESFYEAEATGLAEEEGKKFEVEALARSVVSEFES